MNVEKDIWHILHNASTIDIYCQGRRTYMPSLVQGIVREHFDHIPDNDLGVMLRDCESQRTMDLYGDEQIDKPGWLRWEQDLKDEIERRKDGI